MEKFMNERRYRAELIGIFAVVLLCGALMFIRYGREQKIPAEGTLVKNEIDGENADENRECVKDVAA